MACCGGNLMWPGDALQGIDGHRAIDGCPVRPRLRFRLLETGASRKTRILFEPRRDVADPRGRDVGRTSCRRCRTRQRRFTLDLSSESDNRHQPVPVSCCLAELAGCVLWMAAACDVRGSVALPTADWLFVPRNSRGLVPLPSMGVPGPLVLHHSRSLVQHRSNRHRSRSRATNVLAPARSRCVCGDWNGVRVAGDPTMAASICVKLYSASRHGRRHCLVGPDDRGVRRPHPDEKP